MTTKTLYIYKRTTKTGGTAYRYTLTQEPREGETLDGTAYRLIADTGKVLTDGTQMVSCIDTKEPEKWTEIDEPQPEPEPSDSSSSTEN